MPEADSFWHVISPDITPYYHSATTHLLWPFLHFTLKHVLSCLHYVGGIYNILSVAGFSYRLLNLIIYLCNDFKV